MGRQQSFAEGAARNHRRAASGDGLATVSRQSSRTYRLVAHFEGPNAISSRSTPHEELRASALCSPWPFRTSFEVLRTGLVAPVLRTKHWLPGAKRASASLE